MAPTASIASASFASLAAIIQSLSLSKTESRVNSEKQFTQFSACLTIAAAYVRLLVIGDTKTP